MKTDFQAVQLSFSWTVKQNSRIHFYSQFVAAVSRWQNSSTLLPRVCFLWLSGWTQPWKSSSAPSVWTLSCSAFYSLNQPAFHETGNSAWKEMSWKIPGSGPRTRQDGCFPLPDQPSQNDTLCWQSAKCHITNFYWQKHTIPGCQGGGWQLARANCMNKQIPVFCLA